MTAKKIASLGPAAWSRPHDEAAARCSHAADDRGVKMAARAARLDGRTSGGVHRGPWPTERAADGQRSTVGFDIAATVLRGRSVCTIKMGLQLRGFIVR